LTLREWVNYCKLKHKEKVTQMEIRNFLKIILKRIWLVALIPIIAAVVTAVINFYILEPVYESSITLFVMNKNSDPEMMLEYNDILTTQQLIKDYQELVKSKSITWAVINRLNLDSLTEEELAKKVTVNLKNDARMFEIKVRDTNNVRAKEIVDTINSIFQERVKGLMKIEKLDVVDEAEIPLKPISPKPLTNILIVYFTSLFLVICAVFMMEYLDDRLESIEDVEMLLDINVIGIIPHLDLE
jgi:capsular polysaccharide biosynthesis protein